LQRFATRLPGKRVHCRLGRRGKISPPALSFSRVDGNRCSQGAPTCAAFIRRTAPVWCRKGSRRGCFFTMYSMLAVASPPSDLRVLRLPMGGVVDAHIEDAGWKRSNSANAFPLRRRPGLIPQSMPKECAAPCCLRQRAIPVSC
jgi:hypothetical protein